MAMANMKLRTAIMVSRRIEEIQWGWGQEHKTLLETGKALALPQKTIHEYEENKTVEYCKTEKVAYELASAILCAFVFKNKKEFRYSSLSKSFPESLLLFLQQEKQIHSTGYGYKISDYQKFFKWISKLIEKQIPPVYTIHKNFGRERVIYEQLVTAYANNKDPHPIMMYGLMGRTHPFLMYYITEFLNASFRVDKYAEPIVNIILKGLCQHAGIIQFEIERNRYV